jgi:hypothetical protein
MKALVPVLFALSTAALVGADEIHLVGGGTISGQIVERNAQRVVVETGPGRVTLPMSRVTRIEEGTSALAEFQERARRLEAGDAAGWVALGRWADEHDLGTQADAAFQKALSAEPGNPQANEALGRVQQNGAWVSQEESYRSQGLVPFEGGWVSPAERAVALREREGAEDSARASRESDARVREAEARARAAEAEARQAEAEAAGTQEPASTDGIPFWPYAYGGGGGSHRSHRDPSCCRTEPDPRPTPRPRKPPTGSLNGSGDQKGKDQLPDAPKSGAMQKH